MPAPTKKDYEEQGREHARRTATGGPGEYGNRWNGDTWQHRAWKAGFDAERAGEARVVVTSPRQTGKSILTEAIRRAADTTGWPSGATEHARRLVEDLCKERNDRRRLRLITALHRMAKRHGTPQTSA